MIKRLKRFASIITSLSILIHSALCNESIALTVIDDNSNYIHSIQSTFSHIDFDTYSNAIPLRNLAKVKNVEAYEVQALPLIAANETYAFYPHYIKTVVIVIDRDQTTETINSFKELLQSNLPINFEFGSSVAKNMWGSPEMYHIVLSMAQALYGNYDLHGISNDFYILNNSNRFFTNNLNQPISVMQDTEAVKLINNGRNLEIIVPKDGTISLRGGMLTGKDSFLELETSKLALKKNLVIHGLRSIDGKTGEHYPARAEYERAYFVKDIETYNQAAAKAGRILRRVAFETKRYGFSQNDGRALFYLCFLVVFVLYINSIQYRISNKRIRIGVILICLLQILHISLGCFKALNTTNPTLETILWYGYYVSLVFIPALYLYTALSVGKIQNDTKFSFLTKLHLAISALLVLFVWTNNIHSLVFTVHNHMATTFERNSGYYLVAGWSYITGLVALIIFIVKAALMPRKSTLLFSLGMYIFIIGYIIAFIKKIPFFSDFDFAFSVNIIILLYIEICIQSRLFAVNTKYRTLFSHSQLCMEIQNRNNTVIEKSLLCKKDDSNYIQRNNPICGGTFVYFEDITELNKTKKHLKRINDKIKRNTEFLKMQTTVRADRASLAAEKLVYENIDSILNTETQKIDSLLSELKNEVQPHSLIARINILVCSIKRKCILRINTLDKKTQTISDFLNCLGEMQEFARAVPLHITFGCRYAADISMHESLVMYDLFCTIIELSASKKGTDILVQLYEEDSSLIFSIISDAKINIQPDFLCNNPYKENLSVKPWHGSTAFLLSFPKGVTVK